nr:hypothetical protein CFP56_73555 [Quercus suber]
MPPALLTGGIRLHAQRRHRVTVHESSHAPQLVEAKPRCRLWSSGHTVTITSWSLFPATFPIELLCYQIEQNRKTRDKIAVLQSSKLNKYYCSIYSEHPRVISASRARYPPARVPSTYDHEHGLVTAARRSINPSNARLRS